MKVEVMRYLRTAGLLFVLCLAVGVASSVIDHETLKYQIAHTDELTYVKNSIQTTDGSSVTNYGQHPSPWDLPSQIIGVFGLVVQTVAVVWLSVGYGRASVGTYAQRVGRGMSLAVLFIPFFYLSEYSWGVLEFEPNYWGTDVWGIMSMVSLAYAALIVVICWLVLLRVCRPQKRVEASA